MKLGLLWAVAGVLCGSAAAQQCTTQSQMQQPQKDALVRSAKAIAAAVQANDSQTVRQQTVTELSGNFTDMANAVATTAPRLQGASFQVESVYILDARDNKPGADGKAPDVQFFCNLNGGSQSVVFALQSLPAGRYAVAILNAEHAPAPYAVTLLLREAATGTWQLAGLFPRATTAEGHDGVWYWKAARADAGKKQNWNAWLYYTEAERLLRPAGFVSSSHLELLQDEQSKATPAALTAGVSESTPLIVKAKDGTEYRVTGLAPNDSLGADRIDVEMHYTTTPLPDAVAARARNQKAAAALLAAYPELREGVHGVWVFADAPGGSPFVSEEPVATLR